MQKREIIIDLLGSDMGPEEMLEGARLVLDAFPDVCVALAGPRALVEAANLPEGRYRILEADKTVTNLDNPVEAFYRKEPVSVFKALEEASKCDDALGVISAGNTGALFAGAIRYLLADRAVRPCIAAILPTTQGGFTCLVDTGASIDCGPAQLVEFAHHGSDFMRRLYKLESPRVGLLSNGAEPTKGNKLVKEAHALLAKDESINFVGNIEGNKTLSGLCDVLVCEGFAGNQVLKNSEGMAVNLITEIVKYGKMKNVPAAGEIVAYLMSRFDFASLGAGIMLGTRKLVLKNRGSCRREAVKNAAQILVNLSDNKTVYESIK
jgi:glycerol-3-phosphate acyltransferase PlsX